MNPDAWIARDQCVVRGLYRVDARNFGLAVWDGRDFIGVRHKFNHTYLFGEYHYDDGPPCGTAKPRELLGMVPEGISIDIRKDGEKALFDFLQQHPMKDT